MKITTNKIANRIQLTFAKPKIPVNRTKSRAPLTILPHKIQGLNFPQRVCVLSTILPSSGSITSSIIRTPTIKPVISPIKRLATDLLNPANMPLVTKIIK